MEGPIGHETAGQKLLRLSDYEAIHDDGDNVEEEEEEEEDLEIHPPQQRSTLRRFLLSFAVALAAICFCATVWCFVMLVVGADVAATEQGDAPDAFAESLVMMILTPLMTFVWLYLSTGLMVLWAYPERSKAIKVVENNCCASQKGATRCLARLNIFLAIPLCFVIMLGGAFCFIGPATCVMGYIMLIGTTFLVIGNGIALFLQSNLPLGGEGGLELNAMNQIETSMFTDELPVAVPAASKPIPKGPASATAEVLPPP
ncbi:hypothetical protein CBR_g36838 [Chara braunii]|uniref:Transmembrane protein n=1 Tax=Chara braunii TaxID=69332 RepID=A0A388LLP7_CHABU|nr:hypothetical protein CBR_g36838 [Chara braunii]|eukprot:GBG83224.1 hypothetical protein CBR_g36838 [Chara braunii]